MFSSIFQMNFSSQIFFNNINHGYIAAIFLKIFLWLLPFYMLWLFISIMKGCAEQCALQLYQTSLIIALRGTFLISVSWRRSLSYRNQPINLQSRSIDDLFCIWYGPLSWKSYSRKIADLFEKNINWTWVSQSIIRWPLKPGFGPKIWKSLHYHKKTLWKSWLV